MILQYSGSFFDSPEHGAARAPSSSNQGVVSENKNKTACFDNVDMGVQEEHIVQNSSINVYKIGASVESVQMDR